MKLSPEYIAGLFDGEGTVGLYRDARVYETYKPSVAIELRDEVHTSSVLRTLCEMYGVKLAKKNRGTCAFRLSGTAAIQRFIDDILPYSRLKTTQLVLLQAWLENKSYSYRFAQSLKHHKQRRV